LCTSIARATKRPPEPSAKAQGRTGRSTEPNGVEGLRVLDLASGELRVLPRREDVATIALGSNARFVARAIDVHKNLPMVLKAAHAHKGASFVEIYQNCIVYNDDVFADFTEKKVAAENQIWLEHGQPALFAAGTKGLHLDRNDLMLHVVDVEGGDWEAADVLVHDQTNRGVAQMLIDMSVENGMPVALGVIYNSPAPTFEGAIVEQSSQASQGKKADLQALIAKGQSWQVGKVPRPV
jgi:2-oxoglutarate ferredoxin oxidoreductase subunit beta